MQLIKKAFKVRPDQDLQRVDKDAVFQVSLQDVITSDNLKSV